MSAWRAVSTGAVLVAVAGCAVGLIAAAQASSEPSAASSSPTPSGTSSPSDPAQCGPSASPSATPSPASDPRSLYLCDPAAFSVQTVIPVAAPPSSRPSSTQAATTKPRTQPTTARPKPKPAATTHAAPAPAPAARPAPVKPAPKPPAAPKPPPAPAGQVIPLRYGTGDATQLVTVRASSTGSTTAVVQAWNKVGANRWTAQTGPIAAHVGSDGLSSSPSEYKSATPLGSFTLTQAFGSAGNPGTGLPYFQTNNSDWWVSDVNSPYYNTHYRCSSNCPFNTGAGENLYQAGYVYTYGAVIDYNRSPAVKGAGSAFFLHVTDGSSTAGCVAIPEGNLVSILRWLRPGAHPRIVIEVA